MATHIRRRDSLFIPFENGKSILDSQLKPRMYKSVQSFEKAFPKHNHGTKNIELVEYAEVVRCKDCKHGGKTTNFRTDCTTRCGLHNKTMIDSDFCSYGERRDT